MTTFDTPQITYWTVGGVWHGARYCPALHINSQRTARIREEIVPESFLRRRGIPVICKRCGWGLRHRITTAKHNMRLTSEDDRD